MRVRQNRLSRQRFLSTLQGGDQSEKRQDDEERRTWLPEKDEKQGVEEEEVKVPIAQSTIPSPKSL